VEFIHALDLALAQLHHQQGKLMPSGLKVFCFQRGTNVMCDLQFSNMAAKQFLDLVGKFCVTGIQHHGAFFHGHQVTGKSHCFQHLLDRAGSAAVRSTRQQHQVRA
jgi:hypothetical protein